MTNSMFGKVKEDSAIFVATMTFLLFVIAKTFFWSLDVNFENKGSTLILLF